MEVQSSPSALLIPEKGRQRPALLHCVCLGCTLGSPAPVDSWKGGKSGELSRCLVSAGRCGGVNVELPYAFCLHQGGGGEDQSARLPPLVLGGVEAQLIPAPPSPLLMLPWKGPIGGGGREVPWQHFSGLAWPWRHLCCLCHLSWGISNFLRLPSVVGSDDQPLGWAQV